MSLRRKVLLVFLLVNLLTLAGLAAYALYEGRRSADSVEKPTRQAVGRADLALELTRSLLQGEMRMLSSPEDPSILLATWRIPDFDHPVDHASREPDDKGA